MTTNYIEERENELKSRAEVAENNARDANARAEVAEMNVRDANARADAAEMNVRDANARADAAEKNVHEAENLLKEIAEGMDDEGKLNHTTIKKLLLVTSKL
ncbi:MAG: hypothetical protein IJH63_02235 [Methanobrevibacter sp.]|nr:hypothetical protein [Methanobrevibacter sp.]